jgi:oligosaccharide repeat unit polymerase
MSAPLNRLWWLHPAWPFAAIIGTTIIAAYCQSESAYWLYRTPKYVQFWHVLLAFAIIAAFTLGARFAEATGRAPDASPGDDRIVRRWFFATLILTAVGYVAWFMVGVKNGFSLSMFRELIFTDDPELADWIRKELFGTIPGVTTCTQFGVPCMLLGLWLYFRGQKKLFWPLVILIFVASARCILFSERTALIEIFVPGALVTLRMCVLGRPLPLWCRNALRMAPLVGPVALVLFFGSFEYFRSWRFYQKEFDSYTEFTIWRLSGYYTTAHNNGAMAMETGQWRPLPFNTLRPLWLFPGVPKSPFAYHKLTGHDIEEEHTKMLKRYGNFELNNEGGLFQPTLDYGIAGSLLFWFGYGFVAGRLYRGFQVGTIGGITLYSLIYLSILEVPLVLFLFYPRMFPGLVTLAVVAWTTRRSVASSDLPTPNGALAEAV